MKEKLKKEIEKMIDEKVKKARFVMLQTKGSFWFYPCDIHEIIKAILEKLDVELDWVPQQDGKYTLKKRRKK